MLESMNNTALEYKKLTPEEMAERGILGRLVGVCASFAAPTRNGRKYPEKLWENIFNSDIMKERIANGVCFGELGHPADREETDMEKICICMPEEPKKGPDGKLRAVFDILDTPNGRILKSLCDYGSTLGISSRGSGDLETDFDGQESVNPDTYNCEGFDIVLLPGVKDARLQYVTESLDRKKHNKTLRQQLQESINNETDDNKKIMKESLNTLGIKLTEDAYTKDELWNKFGTTDLDIINAGNEETVTLKYDDETADAFKDDFDVASPQEVADTFNKSVVTSEGDVLDPINEKFIITKIDDNKYALAKGNPPITDLRKTVEANSPEEAKEILMQYGYSSDELTIDNTLLDESAYDDLVSMLSESLELNEALTPEQKMDAWHNGTRRQNIKACKDEKLIMYLKICMDKGYQREMDIIEDELEKRGVDYRDFTNSAQQKRVVRFGPDRLPKAKMLDFNDEKVLGISTRVRDSAILNDLGVDISKLEVLQPADDNDTYFVIRKEYPFAEKVAQAILDIYNKYNDDIDESLNESTYGGYEYQYSVNYAKTPFDNLVLGGSRTIDGAVEIAIGQIQRIFENPWMSAQDKIDWMYNVYIADDTKEEMIEPVEFDDYRENLVSELKTKQKLGEDIEINNEEHLADDNDMAMVNELQEALKLNKMLDEKIVHLQEKLSASYAKEMKLEESITNYKTKIVKLSNKNKEIKALNEKLSKLEIKLKESNDEVQSKKNTLQETLKRDATERKSLQESIESKDNKIAQLSEKLQKATQDISVINENVSVLNEQLETAHKDNRQLKEKYSKKLEQNNQLIEKYKNIAKNAVDKYINKQATILGTTAQEIKNRLPESYTFKDIDNICENLREYKVNMNSLPFNATLNESINFNVKNADERVLYKNLDDEISDADIKLAEKFIR